MGLKWKPPTVTSLPVDGGVRGNDLQGPTQLLPSRGSWLTLPALPTSPRTKEGADCSQRGLEPSSTWKLGFCDGEAVPPPSDEGQLPQTPPNPCPPPCLSSTSAALGTLPRQAWGLNKQRPYPLCRGLVGPTPYLGTPLSWVQRLKLGLGQERPPALVGWAQHPGPQPASWPQMPDPGVA